jgi:hypothetical protein
MPLVSISLTVSAIGMFWFGLVGLLCAFGYDCPSRIKKTTLIFSSIIAMVAGGLMWSMKGELQEWITSNKFQLPQAFGNTNQSVAAGAEGYAGLSDEWHQWGMSALGATVLSYLLVGFWIIRLIKPVRGFKYLWFDIEGECVADPNNIFVQMVESMDVISNAFIVWGIFLFFFTGFSFLRSYRWHHKSLGHDGGKQAGTEAKVSQSRHEAPASPRQSLIGDNGFLEEGDDPSSHGGLLPLPKTNKPAAAVVAGAHLRRTHG